MDVSTPQVCWCGGFTATPLAVRLSTRIVALSAIGAVGAHCAGVGAPLRWRGRPIALAWAPHCAGVGAPLRWRWARAIALIEYLFYYVFPGGTCPPQSCVVDWRSVALGQSEARRYARWAWACQPGTRAVRARRGHPDLRHARLSRHHLLRNPRALNHQ